jgi:hypothetical protein
MRRFGATLFLVSAACLWLLAPPILLRPAPVSGEGPLPREVIGGFRYVETARGRCGDTGYDDRLEFSVPASGSIFTLVSSDEDRAFYSLTQAEWSGRGSSTETIPRKDCVWKTVYDHEGKGVIVKAEAEESALIWYRAEGRFEAYILTPWSQGRALATTTDCGGRVTSRPPEPYAFDIELRGTVAYDAAAGLYRFVPYRTFTRRYRECLEHRAEIAAVGELTGKTG